MVVAAEFSRMDHDHHSQAGRCPVSRSCGSHLGFSLGGVDVIETSDDPQVVLLIRQHAHRAVSEFVTGGMQRAMQQTPLPSDYREASDDDL